MSKSIITDRWAVYHGDCVTTLKGVPSESIGMSIYSPPFWSMYTYSDDPADLANSKTYAEFLEHYGYLAEQLHRLMLPGRVVAVHCMDMPTYKRSGEEIGLRDFPGDLIRIHEQHGFIYHARVCIWKDPLLAAVRTKAIGLAHKQIVKDSSVCRTGIPDYLLAFRKKGENPKPIQHPRGLREYPGGRPVPANLDRHFLNVMDTQTMEKNPYDSRKDKRSHWIWQQIASPVWFDIRQTRTLQYRGGRQQEDERHICLARDSRVLTKERGYVPIQEVRVGEHSLTHMGRWRRVTAVQRTGVKSVVTVHAQGVPGLTLTPDHKLWARKSDWVRARDGAERVNPGWIESKDSLGAYLNLKLPEPALVTAGDADHWWIVGRWLADGFWDSRRGVHISSGESKLKATLEKLGDHAGFRFFTGTAWDIRLSDADGFIRKALAGCGEYAHGKHLPVEAYSLPQEQAKLLVDGYLSGDGHWVQGRKRWMASSVSRDLLLGMALLIQRAYGAVVSIHPGRPEQEREILGRRVQCRQEWVLSFDLPTGRQKKPFILEDGAWKKVRSIEDSGRAETWNIRIKEDESFTAEGCIVKNCPLQRDVIDRCLMLWSMEDDVVLSPFAGIGSEIHEAVRLGRRGLGVELKRSYFRMMLRNLQSLDRKREASLT